VEASGAIGVGIVANALLDRRQDGDAAETQSELAIGILLDQPPAAARQRRRGGVGDTDLDRLHLARDVRREHGGAHRAAHRGSGRLAAPPGPARPALAAA